MDNLLIAHLIDESFNLSKGLISLVGLGVLMNESVHYNVCEVNWMILL